MNTLKNSILSLDGRMPRYTSYPTAPHFKAMDDRSAYLQALGSISPQDDLSLYLHVPFCSQMCWYCGCHTKITQRYAPVEDYVHLMLREIDLLAEALGDEHPARVKNIHFGGGSPGMLRAQDFDLIMRKIRERLTVLDNADIAIELDPRGVTESRIQAYARHGVNRVSLGIQDFDARVLKAVNREQPFALSYDAIKLCRQYGIDRINVDIMYGLPYQSLETQSQTLSKLMELSPDRISFFAYAHVPWMKKHMRLIQMDAMPSTELRFDLFEAGQKFLMEHGYMPVGIDHFAKEGDSMISAQHDHKLRRNFQGYVDDTSTHLIGIGVSSIGRIGDVYFQNTSDMPRYKDAILGHHLPAFKHCTLSSDDKIRADIIEQIMCYLEVDIEIICNRHGYSPREFEAELSRLEMFVEMGLIEICDYYIRILPEAKLATRMIGGVFDAYLAPANANIQNEEIERPRHAQAI